MNKLKRGDPINEKYLYNGDKEKISISGHIPTNFPVGLYTGASGKRYFIQFNLQDTGYPRVDPYLTSDRGYCSGYKSNYDGAYLLSSGYWNHGLNSNNTLYNVGKWLDQIPENVRRDPWLCSRYICGYISRATNYHNALVAGTWNYGRTKFGSSLTDIMQTWIYNRITYGQCFTFSAALCGLLRHVGIPSRQVVCTNAGHSSNRAQQLTLVDQSCGDRYKDDHSMVWNFHSWVLCFLRTIDRPNGEWCVIDATPQEKSLHEPLRGRYVCGPCPIRALKDANNLNYPEKNLDMLYISVGTRGPVSWGVEYYTRGMSRPLHVYYYRDLTGDGTDVYEQNSSCTGFVDCTNDYKCNTPFPQENYGVTITQVGFGRRVTVANPIPGLEMYLVLLQTSRRWINRHPPTTSINYYKVKPIVNNMFSNGDISGYTHAYVVVGIRKTTEHMHASRLVKYQSIKVK